MTDGFQQGAPLGILRQILTHGVFPPSDGLEQPRADHAVVEAAALANGDTENYQSFEQQRSLAGAKLEKELKKRFFRWAPARSSIEELVGQLIPSRMAAIVKTKGGVMKTRLIHVLRRSGVNNLAAIPERIELTRLIDAVLGVLDMVQRCNSGESVDIANLDFADTFKQPQVTTVRTEVLVRPY